MVLEPSPADYGEHPADVDALIAAIRTRAEERRLALAADAARFRATTYLVEAAKQYFGVDLRPWQIDYEGRRPVAWVKGVCATFDLSEEGADGGFRVRVQCPDCCAFVWSVAILWRGGPTTRAPSDHLPQLHGCWARKAVALR